MKFTKEDANKELVIAMTSKGETLSMSNRTINEQIDNLYTLIANEEMELNDFVNKTLPILKTVNSNIRNDVSVGIKDYKDKNPNTTNDKPDTTKTDDNSDLLKRLELMEQKIRDNENENKKRDLKKTITLKLKEQGVKDEDWINDLLEEVPMEGDFDVEGKVKKYLALYNKSKANIKTDLSPQDTTRTSESDKALFAKAKEFREKRLKEQGIIKS